MVAFIPKAIASGFYVTLIITIILIVEEKTPGKSEVFPRTEELNMDQAFTLLKYFASTGALSV